MAIVRLLSLLVMIELLPACETATTVRASVIVNSSVTASCLAATLSPLFGAQALTPIKGSSSRFALELPPLPGESGHQFLNLTVETAADGSQRVVASTAWWGSKEGILPTAALRQEVSILSAVARRCSPPQSSSPVLDCAIVYPRRTVAGCPDASVTP
jgi:hypothetical protein